MAKRGYKGHLKKRKLQERNIIPRTEALKQHKQAIKDQSEQVLFTIAYNLASPNIQDTLRKKKRILYSTQRLKKNSTKKYLLLLSVAHLTFVTYSFVRNSQTPAIHQRPLLAHFAVTPNTDASPAHSLIMEERRTLLSTQEKQETQNIMLLYGLN